MRAVPAGSDVGTAGIESHAGALHARGDARAALADIQVCGADEKSETQKQAGSASSVSTVRPYLGYDRGDLYTGNLHPSLLLSCTPDRIEGCLIRRYDRCVANKQRVFIVTI